MSNYPFPAIIPNSASWTPLTNTATFTSPLTMGIQTAVRQGGRWGVSMSFNNLIGADRSILTSFIAKLNGQQHRYAVGPFGETYRGTGGGSPQVNGAGQSGFTLLTEGWPNNSNVMLAGDYFSINNGLKICTLDTASDGSGNATLTFWPELHAFPADNQTIEIDDPLSIFMLTSDPVVDTIPGLFSSIVINGIQDVLA